MLAASPFVAFYSAQDTFLLSQSNVCPNFILFIYSFAITHLLRSSWIHVLLCLHHSRVIPGGKQSHERLAVFMWHLQDNTRTVSVLPAFTSGPATPNFGLKLTRDNVICLPRHYSRVLSSASTPWRCWCGQSTWAGCQSPLRWDCWEWGHFQWRKGIRLLSPFHCLQQLSYLLPPHPTCFWSLPCRGDNSEALLGRTKSQLQAKRAAVSCFSRRGSGQKCLCASCLQRKINGYKEQTCFLRKSAMKVPWTCVIFLLPECD